VNETLREKILPVLAIGLSAVLASCSTFHVESERLKAEIDNSVVRITATVQMPSYHAPWIWHQPVSRSGQGVVVGKNLVLTLASNVMNAKVIRMTIGTEPTPTPLTIKAINYDSNLALLTGNLPPEAKPLDIPPVSVFKHAAPLRMYWKTGNGTIVEGSAVLDKADTRYNFNSFQTQIMFHAIRSSHPQTGYGVPVFDNDGHFFGLATQGGNEYDFIIIICDTIARSFDLKKGAEVCATGMPGFNVSPLTQTYLRRKLGLANTDGGCLVTKVLQQGAGSKQLKKGDVLLALDGHPLDAWGRYKHPLFGPTFQSHLFSEHFVTEPMKATIVRDKKKIDIDLKLSDIDDSKWIIPVNPSYKPVDYLVRGGFVFLPLTLTYVKEWGGDYMNKAPISLLSALSKARGKLKTPEKREVVVLSRVLSHPTNIGLQEFGDNIVEEVDGKPLKSLAELKEILNDTSRKVVKLTLLPGRIPLWLSPATLKSADKEVKLRYGINQLERLTPRRK